MQPAGYYVNVTTVAFKVSHIFASGVFAAHNISLPQPVYPHLQKQPCIAYFVAPVCEQ
jgi:hypothetical protein